MKRKSFVFFRCETNVGVGVGERQRRIDFRQWNDRIHPLVHFAHVMADRQPEIPQRIQEGVEKLFVGRSNRRCEQDQQVDV